ncbi:uncharacterized protein LOC141993236 [Natator depressus]|uniref:uncharacterized protein LOC141993236 n=1 Tax=Natator depressus TaxID=27790 RepID=UPI003EB75534
MEQENSKRQPKYLFPSSVIVGFYISLNIKLLSIHNTNKRSLEVAFVWSQAGSGWLALAASAAGRGRRFHRTPGPGAPGGRAHSGSLGRGSGGVSGYLRLKWVFLFPGPPPSPRGRGPVAALWRAARLRAITLPSRSPVGSGREPLSSLRGPPRGSQRLVGALGPPAPVALDVEVVGVVLGLALAGAGVGQDQPARQAAVEDHDEQDVEIEGQSSTDVKSGKGCFPKVGMGFWKKYNGEFSHE